MLTVVANLKGGTGKSTVAFNLALWLLAKGHRVQAVDLDPQGTLGDVLEVRQEEGYSPALPATTDADVALGRQGDFDHWLVDVGPSAMDTLMQAVAAADRVLIPVPPSQADVWSTHRFVREIQGRRTDRDTGPGIEVFINRADTHQFVRETEETAEALQQIEGIRFLRPRLKQRTAFRRSFSEGLAVNELEPSGKAAEELDRLARAIFG
ncbi:AAA family ATPase [Thioalkalivibrio halophilus]|uniref:Chromosome partitioning protein n=1 Tax=Thioalkalivibrio halophilus TaxID=252474 RepID=A0A1V2ZZI0_9GAMM|nr:AAA family ATPase [Thioalkalivibrio halophilus]OOC10514.1 chromosome partitioning protein [Thioalkalivibrio halophilus]